MAASACAACEDALERGIAIIAHAGGHSAAQRFIDFWSGAGAWHTVQIRRQDYFATRMRAALQHFEALFREPLHQAHLAWLRMPVLFMSGARTIAATRRIAELLRSALRDATHERLPSMGHLGPIARAEQFNRRIVGFLQELQTAPTRVSASRM